MNLQEHHIGGLTFKVRPDTVDTWILHEVIEADYYAVRVIRESWDNLSTIIDVGAHIGAFTVWCKKLWPQAEIFAIEASPENFEILRLNAAHLRGVHLLHRAVVGDDRSHTRFTTVEDVRRTHPEWVHNTGGLQISDAGTAVVPTLRLSEIVRKLERVDLIKFDCEGAEGDGLLDLKSSNQTPKIGWVRGEWHGIENVKKVVEGLQPTHRYKLDQRGWGDFCGGMFIAHRIRGFI
jgi:FkbM family methyltransferase